MNVSAMNLIFAAFLHSRRRLVPAGKVSAQLRLLGDQRIYLIWQERDGPPVSAPAKGGFGKRPLESVLSRELGAPRAAALRTNRFHLRAGRPHPEDARPPGPLIRCTAGKAGANNLQYFVLH